MDGGVVVATCGPATDGAPVPLVILIPGLDSTKEEFFAWESVFLRPRDGDALARRPRAGRDRLASPIRPDYEVAVARHWTRWPTAPSSTCASERRCEPRRYYVVRAAAFEPRPGPGRGQRSV